MTSTRRRPVRNTPKWFLPVGAGALALVVLGIAISRLGGGDTRPRYEIAAGKNVAINQDAVSLNAHNSPVVVANPTDPKNLVVANRTDRPVRSGSLHVSKDGGAKWTDVALPAPEPQPGFAPDIGFDAKGRLFVIYSTVPRGQAVGSAVFVTSSDDGGATLKPPVRVLGAYTFDARLAVAPDGRLYLTWLQADRAAVPDNCLPCFGRTGLPIMAATSTDGGQTWSTPVRVSDSNRPRVAAPSPSVGPKGDLYVLYQDYKDDREDWENLTAPAYKGSMALVLSHSGDQAATFSPGVVVDDGLRTLDRFLVFFPKYSSLAVGPAGDLNVAWQDARNGDYDVLFRRSTDGGRTWNGPIRINDDPVRNGRHQYLPVLSASVPGRIDALFYDRRDDPRNLLVAATFATSLDQGDHWRSVPASDQLFDSRIGPGSERNIPDAGSRLGLVSFPDRAFAVWTDSRRGSLDTDKQDIVGAKVLIARKNA